LLAVSFPLTFFSTLLNISSSKNSDFLASAFLDY